MSNITTSQPQSLIDAIKRQAEREGVTVSQWVGAACLGALKLNERESVKQRSPVGFPVGKKRIVKKKKNAKVNRKVKKHRKAGRPAK